MSKIILEAEGKLEDTELRRWVQQIATKVETINERTKLHTLYIKRLRKEMQTFMKS